MHRELRTVRTWHEWLAEWERAELVEVRHHLLHIAPLVGGDSESSVAERWIFFLEMADGWARFENFRTPKEKGATADGPNDLAVLRRTLAQKAFSVLCEHFFVLDKERDNKHYDPANRHPEWARIVAIPKVLTKLLWFFRLESDSQGRRTMPNLQLPFGDVTASISIKVARTREFLFDLTRFLLGFKSWRERWSESDEDRQTKDLFAKYRVDCIDLLHGIGRLDCLERAFEMTKNEQVMKRLTEIALSEQYWRNDLHADQQPRTIEEAWFEGHSQAARVILLIQAGMRASEVLEAEKEERRRLAEAERVEAEKQRRAAEAAKLREKANKLERA